MHVVAIGVNDYPNPEWRRASEIAHFFEANTDVLSYEPETTRIAGSCATGSEIRSVFADVARTATRDDTVLIFMGGHGLRLPADCVAAVA